MNPELVKMLCTHGDQALEALKIIAESYLARSGRAMPSWGEGGAESIVPNITLVGESGYKYRPKRFLARGSAGLIYAAEKAGEEEESFVLKRVYPTQAESALNEYKIATRLRGCKGCLSYEDCIVTGGDDKEIWLVLPLISRSEQYGVDLREYLTKGFFQVPGHDSHARAIAIQLLEGLDEVSMKGVIMRDVKPDNVLIRRHHDNGRYEAFWTDFGLAVDLGPKFDGSNLRKVNPLGGDNLRDEFVCWWYDSCKLVPRPKWQARRPPERGFADPHLCNGAHSFDSYMTGIIYVCIAIGIDLPHIDQADSKAALEKFLGKPFNKDYLQSFELGASLRTDSAVYLKAFEKTFGTKFGKVLFELTVAMLSIEPIDRPKPSVALVKLREVV